MRAINQSSYPVLAGSAVDYSDRLEGAMYAGNNPRVNLTCGCGASFSF